MGLNRSKFIVECNAVVISAKKPLKMCQNGLVLSGAAEIKSIRSAARNHFFQPRFRPVTTIFFFIKLCAKLWQIQCRFCQFLKFYCSFKIEGMATDFLMPVLQPPHSHCDGHDCTKRKILLSAFKWRA